MKIKLDENLPFRLRTPLDDLGHDVHTMYDEGLTGHPDNEIWERAQEESRFLITQDLDFSDSRRSAPGTQKGMLLVRLRSPARGTLTRRILELFRTENVLEWTGCFVVASERKIRVLRPANKQQS